MSSIAILTLLIEVGLVVHVIKTGRNTIWIWVLVLLPGVGMLAYLLVEVLPDLFRSRATRSAMRGVQRAVDPDRDLRRATATAAVSDTVVAKARLGAELARRGEYATAIETYRAGLKGIYEHDPTLLLGLAEAQFAAGDAGGARTSLEALIANNPDFKSADGHLLYARALEAEGNLAKAESEYRAVAGYFPGAEARVRHALLLKKSGRGAEARAALEDVVKSAELAPRHVRRAQAEWLEIARRELAP
ncbi:MAG TPA: tetratricopeptide repeat protein [Steroidobacteraceae bacterium]|nr:tetratricopeptide repeat protein [Steroidobacteraceae bacterium]